MMTVAVTALIVCWIREDLISVELVFPTNTSGFFRLRISLLGEFDIFSSEIVLLLFLLSLHSHLSCVYYCWCGSLHFHLVCHRGFIGSLQLHCLSFSALYSRIYNWFFKLIFLTFISYVCRNFVLLLSEPYARLLIVCYAQIVIYDVRM